MVLLGANVTHPFNPRLVYTGSNFNSMMIVCYVGCVDEIEY